MRRKLIWNLLYNIMRSSEKLSYQIWIQSESSKAVRMQATVIGIIMIQKDL